MKVLVLGVDGYLGWPLALHLRELGHEVESVPEARTFILRVGMQMRLAGIAASSAPKGSAIAVM